MSGRQPFSHLPRSLRRFSRDNAPTNISCKRGTLHRLFHVEHSEKTYLHELSLRPGFS